MNSLSRVLQSQRLVLLLPWCWLCLCCVSVCRLLWFCEWNKTVLWNRNLALMFHFVDQIEALSGSCVVRYFVRFGQVEINRNTISIILKTSIKSEIDGGIQRANWEGILGTHERMLDFCVVGTFSHKNATRCAFQDQIRSAGVRAAPKRSNNKNWKRKSQCFVDRSRYVHLLWFLAKTNSENIFETISGFVHRNVWFLSASDIC